MGREPMRKPFLLRFGDSVSFCELHLGDSLRTVTEKVLKRFGESSTGKTYELWAIISGDRIEISDEEDVRLFITYAPTNGINFIKIEIIETGNVPMVEMDSSMKGQVPLDVGKPPGRRG